MKLISGCTRGQVILYIANENGECIPKSERMNRERVTIDTQIKGQER